MITPGALGLLEAMADGPIADLEPTFEPRTGTIRYPDAERFLSEDTVPTLNSLARRGVLEREFREKTHRCPDCEFTELQYTTACPACDSPDTLPVTVLEHTACGHAAPRERFDSAGACPDCETPFCGVGVEFAPAGRRYRCVACAWRFSEPASRLRCRRCACVLQPSHAPETVLYRYRFDESRREWLYTQLAARGAVGDVLGRRGFETVSDAIVAGASGTEYRIDLHATDEERGLAVIGSVAETPSTDDVIGLHAASIDIDAYPVLIVTGDEPGDVAAELAAHLDVGVFHPTEPCEPAVAMDASWSEPRR